MSEIEDWLSWPKKTGLICVDYTGNGSIYTPLTSTGTAALTVDQGLGVLYGFLIAGAVALVLYLVFKH
ncbi:unnamed protein product [Dicrocoelium dendriticum]|nr:unnamed protein product [Dicrocoelium dendriticum]